LHRGAGILAVSSLPHRTGQWCAGDPRGGYGLDEWYVRMEVHELAVLRDGRRAPHGAAFGTATPCTPCCFLDSSEIPATPEAERACGDPVSWDQVICFATVAVV
jgi:hypothetical protein